jgi:hypothetical protein
MEAKCRFRLLREKPKEWIFGETPSRLFYAPTDLRRTERESVQEEDREMAKTRMRDEVATFPKQPLPRNFAISPFRHFALKVLH